MDDRVTRVVLENDEVLEARNVLSSAGWCETMRLCDDGHPVVTSRAPGQLTFCETIATLDAQPSDLGHDRTITFFNDHEKFVWQKPDGLCDVRSGVICSPNNFAYDEPLDDGTIRITALANFDRWRELDEEAYRLEKLRWYDRITESAVRFIPDYRSRVIDTDMFTPTTVVRFTGHDNGAVYGAPDKQLDGTTHLKNLFICGTDQGFVGIIGSITSGIAMANLHCLRGEAGELAASLATRVLLESSIGISQSSGVPWNTAATVPIAGDLHGIRRARKADSRVPALDPHERRPRGIRRKIGIHHGRRLYRRRPLRRQRRQTQYRDLAHQHYFRDSPRGSVPKLSYLIAHAAISPTHFSVDGDSAHDDRRAIDRHVSTVVGSGAAARTSSRHAD